MKLTGRRGSVGKVYVDHDYITVALSEVIGDRAIVFDSKDHDKPLPKKETPQERADPEVLYKLVY